MSWAGINNENEFYSEHYLSEILLLSPPRSNDKKPYVCDGYAQDTVSNLEELAQQAEYYGLGVPFSEGMQMLAELTGRLTIQRTTPVFIVLAVRRPWPLMHEDSDIELVPYVLELTPESRLEDAATTPVWPVAMLDRISRKLLARVSGITPSKAGPFSLIGCGSIGSKLALHLARSGVAPRHVMDKNAMRPHNAARHALVPENPVVEYGAEPKAKALAQCIEKFNQNCKPFVDDAISLTSDSELLKKFCPKDTFAVVNSSASLSVRAVVSKAPMSARVVETILYSSGDVAVMTLEGPKRNPNSSDIMLTLYTVCIEDPGLRERLFSDQESVTRLEIGLGCGSPTMAMTDSKLSLSSAAMTGKLLDWHASGALPNHAQIFFGSIGDNGIDFAWESFEVEPFLEIKERGRGNWKIRISPMAHKKILEECKTYSKVETGGVLVGSICELQGVITVTDVISAPEDSKRSATEFFLGTRGLYAQLDTIMDYTRGSIYCLGTWHSHLADCGPSSRDHQTAEIIAERAPVPQLMLIKTPKAYQAITINT